VRDANQKKSKTSDKYGINTTFKEDNFDITILYAHGGAFWLGSAVMWMEFYQNIINNLKAKGKRARIFSLEYTYSTQKPFPQQQHEMAAAYTYLLEKLKIRPNTIFLGGDSAGGNLVLSTLFANREWPLPAGLLLISPWVHLVRDINSKNHNLDDQSSAVKNASNDWIKPVFLRKGFVTYVPNSSDKESAEENQISPLFATSDMLSPLPPVYLVYGGSEILLDSITAFQEKLLEACGDKVTIQNCAGQGHDWICNKQIARSDKIFYDGVESICTWLVAHV